MDGKVKSSKILVVCTAGKDRSVAIANALKNEYRTRARGISVYNAGDRRFTVDDIEWADIVLCAENVHQAAVNAYINALKDVGCEIVYPHVRILHVGSFNHDIIDIDDILRRANRIINKCMLKNTQE